MPHENPMAVASELAAAERAQAGGKDAPELIGNVLNAVVKFTKVEDYTTFLAEYAFKDNDIILHFFPPREAYIEVAGRVRLPEEALLKWQRSFPQVLSPTAESYFQATQPVLQAKYTAEMYSWWFKAAGYAQCLDPEAYVLRFLERLDLALDAASFSF